MQHLTMGETFGDCVQNIQIIHIESVIKNGSTINFVITFKGRLTIEVDPFQAIHSAF